MNVYIQIIYVNIKITVAGTIVTDIKLKRLNRPLWHENHIA